jgi:DNA-binding NtrC family response regulator
MTAQDSRLAGLIQEYLAETGYDVVCELNLDSALGTLIATDIDLLMVDGEMPEKVLKDFLETIARLRPELPVIVVGMSEHQTESKSLSGFVSAFIEKPFSISDVSDTIKETLN